MQTLEAQQPPATRRLLDNGEFPQCHTCHSKIDGKMALPSLAGALVSELRLRLRTAALRCAVLP